MMGNRFFTAFWNHRLGSRPPGKEAPMKIRPIKRLASQMCIRDSAWPTLPTRPAMELMLMILPLFLRIKSR